MYALVDYSGNQILIKEGEKIRIPFTDKKVGTKIDRQKAAKLCLNR